MDEAAVGRASLPARHEGMVGLWLQQDRRLGAGRMVPVHDERVTPTASTTWAASEFWTWSVNRPAWHVLWFGQISARALREAGLVTRI